MKYTISGQTKKIIYKGHLISVKEDYPTYAAMPGKPWGFIVEIIPISIDISSKLQSKIPINPTFHILNPWAESLQRRQSFEEWMNTIIIDGQKYKLDRSNAKTFYYKNSFFNKYNIDWAIDKAKNELV